MAECRDCVARLLGVCRGDFCYTERVTLVERARRRAAQFGHELGPFTKVARRPTWEARCERCAECAVITIDPEPGQPAMSGKVLRTPCHDRQSAGAAV